MKIFYICDKNGQIDKEGSFVLAGFMGGYLLGIIFHCYKSGFEGNASFYTFNSSIWNWRASPSCCSAPKRYTIFEGFFTQGLDLYFAFSNHRDCRSYPSSSLW